LSNFAPECRLFDSFLGVILADLVEILSRKMTHRGISLSAGISVVALVLLWPTPIRDTWIGVVYAHLFMASFAMMGVPLLDERSRRIRYLAGSSGQAHPPQVLKSEEQKLRNTLLNYWASEDVDSCPFAPRFCTVSVLGSFSLYTERRNWQELHKIRNCG